MNRLEWVFHSFRDETDSPGGRRSLKCSGLTMLLLTLRAMVLILILGCKTAHWSTLARKSLFSDSASTAEAPRAETSLLPVWAISGLGAFTSSSRSSDWSRLIWRIEFLTKSIPATFQHFCSCWHLLLPLKFQLDQGFLFTSCSKPLSDAHYPPAVAQLLHSTSKVAACTWLVSWFPRCFLPWCIKPSVSSFCKQLYKCQILLTVHVRGGKVKGLRRRKNGIKLWKYVFPFLLVLCFSGCHFNSDTETSNQSIAMTIPRNMEADTYLRH